MWKLILNRFYFNLLIVYQEKGLLGILRIFLSWLKIITVNFINLIKLTKFYFNLRINDSNCHDEYIIYICGSNNILAGIFEPIKLIKFLSNSQTKNLILFNSANNVQGVHVNEFNFNNILKIANSPFLSLIIIKLILKKFKVSCFILQDIKSSVLHKVICLFNLPCLTIVGSDGSISKEQDDISEQLLWSLSAYSLNAEIEKLNLQNINCTNLITYSNYQINLFHSDILLHLNNCYVNNKKELNDVKVIKESGLFDFNFAPIPFKYYPNNEFIIRRYVRSWASGIEKRKPFPGFHPGIYKDSRNLICDKFDPFSEFIKDGMPNGDWCLPVITSYEKDRYIAETIRVALHLHVHYVDLLNDIIERLNKNLTLPDLFISTHSIDEAYAIKKLLKGYAGRVVKVEIFPNIGRDIGPFLTGFRSSFVGNYDLIGHIHTKKSLGRFNNNMTAKNWNKFLLENTLGGDAGAMMDKIIYFFNTNDNVGMVFPDDPNIIGWDSNKEKAEVLTDKLRINLLPNNFFFPVGTMFWARVEALKPFWELNLEWDDYPKEPISLDGTLLHALERLFPLGMAKRFNKLAVTHVNGFTR